MIRLARLKLFLMLGLAFASTPALAAGFAAMASPPRFELALKPGETRRSVVEISNASGEAARYLIRTADWTFDESATVQFSDALLPGSCRPWVAIERAEVTIPAGGRLRYRFEVAVPPDANVGECRFVLLVEGQQQTVSTASGLSIPVTGRLGVIVYVAVGAAAPVLEVVGTSIAEVNGLRLPALHLRNTGNAHGRLSGFLSGTDAKGRALEFTPSTLPILPGETRRIVLAASAGRDELVDVAFPVSVRGSLEWADQRLPFDHRFD